MTTILTNSEGNNMSSSQKLMKIETIETEEIIEDTSSTKKANKVLNALIEKAITLSENQWKDLFEKLSDKK